MKTILTILLVLTSLFSFSQEKKKVDKIYFNDGSTIEVFVKKVTANQVVYSYPNETVQNEEDVANISSIVFASGRRQEFKHDNSNNQSGDYADQEKAEINYKPIEPNTISILPVVFHEKESGRLMEEQSKMAQARIYDFFEDAPNKISPLTLQDTRNTNAYLRKANVDFAALDETPVVELEKMLGTEFLVLSKVVMDVRHNTTVNESTWKKDEKKDNKRTDASYTTVSANENKIYNYVVVLEIYKGNKKIYNESRKPFLTTEDAWKDALEYMLKRSPIYKRR